MAHEYEWSQRVVLITGAATGIGALVVRLLLQQDVKHVAVLDVDERAGTQLQDELNSKHGAGLVKFYKCDVSDDQLLHAIFDSVHLEQGYLDVVINNAAIMNDRLNVFKKEIQINVTALVSGTLKAIELMRRDKGGRGGTVINIASIAALLQGPMLPVYYATKSAVLQFSNCIGLDEYYSRTGVRVLAICFGATDTALLSTQKMGSFDPDYEDDMVKYLDNFTIQKAESAAAGLVAAYRRGASGSTWLVDADLPARDISADVRSAYQIMSSHMS